jgi:hypothetical protein
MDYFVIIKRAWQITWQNKFLWLFGVFVTGVGGAVFNFTIPQGGIPNLPEEQISQVYQNSFDFFAKYWFVFLFIGLALLFLFLLFFVLNIASEGALIGSVDKIEKGETVNIKEGFKIGFANFWKIFSLKIIFTVLVLAALFILAAPAVSLFILEMYGRALILLFFALVIFLPLVFITSFIVLYAMRFIVLKNLKVFQSISLGFNLLKKNIIPTIIIILILILASFIVGVGFFGIILFVFIPLVILAVGAYFIGGIIGVVALGLPAILLFILTTALVGAVYNTFSSSVWTLTYLEFVKKGL